ncbi:hypothetical protein SK128_016568, partial [Halocaridina rubra]
MRHNTFRPKVGRTLFYNCLHTPNGILSEALEFISDTNYGINIILLVSRGSGSTLKSRNRDLLEEHCLKGPLGW